jgi:predicted RNA methylase
MDAIAKLEIGQSRIGSKMVKQSNSRPLIGTFRKKVVRAIRVAWSRLNDWYLNIETGDEADARHPRLYGLPNNMAKYKDAIAYQAVDYIYVRRVIRILAPGQDDVFYDVGCGKGRCVCMFARLAIRRAVGIELNGLLCDAARTNATRLRGRKTLIEIRCEDAAKTDLSDGTTYFMFNPFGAETMRDVLAGIKRSLTTNPRKVTIIYANPLLSDMFRAQEWLQKVHEFKTVTGNEYTFWVKR